MVSKRWQVTNSWVQHGVLMGIGASFFYWVPQELMFWQKMLYLVVSIAVVSAVGLWTHRRFANTLVKVYQIDYGDLSWMVQRELKTLYIPYTKKSNEQKMELHFRGKDIALTIEDFPLNMMYDDHIHTVSASKVTVTPIREERPFVTTLCQKIDQAYVAYGEKNVA